MRLLTKILNTFTSHVKGMLKENSLADLFAYI